MKKFLMLWVLALVMLTGMDVQAADTKDATAIMKQCYAVTNAKKVYRVDEYLIADELTEKIYTVAIDKNTKITYIDLFGVKFYVDDKNNLIYMYSSKEGKWYVDSTSSSDDTDDMVPDDKDDIVPDDDTIMSDAIYTYKETITYRGGLCDVIEATPKDSSINAYIVYYVDESTYELLHASRISNGLEVTIDYFYPESVTIPQEVTSNAVLDPGGSVTIDGITYTASRNSKKRTVEVAKSTKAEKVTIPDKITFLGKDYKVIGIADNAFAKNKKIKKITLGKNIKTIGKQAFFKCKNLKQVTIRSTVLKKVGSKAFYGNAKALKVQAPKSKRTKYRKLIEKAKTTSKLKM